MWRCQTTCKRWTSKICSTRVLKVSLCQAVCRSWPLEIAPVSNWIHWKAFFFPSDLRQIRWRGLSIDILGSVWSKTFLTGLSLCSCFEKTKRSFGQHRKWALLVRASPQLFFVPSLCFWCFWDIVDVPWYFMTLLPAPLLLCFLSLLLSLCFSFSIALFCSVCILNETLERL